MNLVQLIVLGLHPRPKHGRCQPANQQTAPHQSAMPARIFTLSLEWKRRHAATPWPKHPGMKASLARAA
jgi:hypothetical protein